MFYDRLQGWITQLEPVSSFDFLATHQLFILLFDEILEYINRALDVRGDLDVSLGTQTFSFFQELTEAVAALPQGMLIVTLPSSHLEDFGERQDESLAWLAKIFGRVESIETPVQGEEVYAVIRRRLFEEETLRRIEMREIVHYYFQVYQQNRDDLPPKVCNVNYREKTETCARTAHNNSTLPFTAISTSPP